MWLSSLIWGELYVHGTAYLGIWNGTNVRLFGVRQAPQTRTVGETMQNVIGGLGWGTSPSTTPSAVGGGGAGVNATSPSSQSAHVTPSRSNSSARSVT